MVSQLFTSATLAGLALASSPTWAASPVEPASSTWVATWQASPQAVWDDDFLFPTNVPATLRGQTIRQVARISLGGHRLRVVLSNAHGKVPVAVGQVSVALPGQQGAVTVGSLQEVTFGGRRTATILPGASLISDPVPLALQALSQVSISIHLPGKTPVSTFHWDGRQTGWIAPGNQTMRAVLSRENGQILETTARPLLAGIQVDTSLRAQPESRTNAERSVKATPSHETGSAPQDARVRQRPTEGSAQAVAVIGDSITDGATASLDRNRRWPDFLANRLAPHGVAVINAGISGARLLSDGMGVNALARLDRDVLTQPGVRSLIVLLGINDIAWPGTAFARTERRPTLDELTAGYRQLVTQAHARGVRVIGATLTPFSGALPDTPLDDYYHPDKDALRRQVNDWIRHSGVFDAVIDFDAALRDPKAPERLAAPFDSGDHLHPGDEGNRAMADAVDLKALLPGLR